GGNQKQEAALVVISPPHYQSSRQTPTYAPESLLSVNPTGFNGNTNCSYAQGQGWFCVINLINSKGERSLNWSASSSGLPGISFYPARGILPPGYPMSVAVFVPNTTCPATATFTFLGAKKPLNVPWNCTSPGLIASPGNFDNGCLSCAVTLAPSPDFQGIVD